MNNARRADIKKALKELEPIKDLLIDLEAQEREVQDNKPESLQNYEAADFLGDACNGIGEVIENLESIE
jgi:copper chaperone CopZ